MISSATPTARGSRPRKIPPDRSSMGDDVVLAELNNQRTLDIIKTARSSNAGSEARKMADFYDAFMDEAAIQKSGLKSLQPQLQEIAALKNRKELSRLLGSQFARGHGCPECDGTVHEQPAWSVDSAGPGQSVALCPLHVAGWPGHAGPRLLSRQGRIHGGDTWQVPGTRGARACAGGDCRCQREGRAHLRSGNEDGCCAQSAFRCLRHGQGKQPLVTQRLRQEVPRD